MRKVFKVVIHKTNIKPSFPLLGTGNSGLGMHGLSFETSNSTNLKRTQARTICFENDRRNLMIKHQYHHKVFFWACMHVSMYMDGFRCGPRGANVHPWKRTKRF